MDTNEIRNRLIRESIKDDSWIKAAKWRQENEYWVSVSQDIAINILSHLRAKSMTQKELAALLEFSPQHMSKILKGKENLTIESICRIEKALQIKLIDTSVFQSAIQYNPVQSSSVSAYNYNIIKTRKHTSSYTGESKVEYGSSRKSEVNKSIPPTGYALRHISTEQFAIIEEAYTEGKDINLITQLKFGTNSVHKIIALHANFKFEQEGKSFVVIEASGHFSIDENSWKCFYNEEANTLTVPQGFMSHLAVLVIGTTRGILHAKTENTPFNRFFLPTINVMETIKEDVVIELN